MKIIIFNFIDGGKGNYRLILFIFAIEGNNIIHITNNNLLMDEETIMLLLQNINYSF